MILGLWVGVALAAPVCGGEPVQGALSRFEAVLVEPDGDNELAFAHCLWEMGLRHSAQRHALEVVALGPGAPSFSEALGTAMVWSRELGDLYSVRPYLRGVSRRHVSDGQGRDDVLLAHGRFLRATGQPIRAVGVLEEIDPDYVWIGQARHELGQALWEANQLREAVDIWRGVQEGPWASLSQMARSDALASWGENREAIASLEGIEGPAPVMASARLREASLWLRLGDSVEARQALVAARQHGGREWPEWHLMWAQVALEGCRVGAASKHLKALELEWQPVALALDGIADSGHPNGQMMYTRFLGADPVDMGLPSSVHMRAQLDADLDAVQRHLDHIEAEISLLETIENPAFEAILSPHIEDVLRRGQWELQTQGGHLYGRSLARQRIQIREVLDDGSALTASLDGACQ